jgi:DNA-binding transcriptional LysR family regulator
MNLNDLSLFIRVVETGSFTAAADSLNVQKSTISRRIAQLEDTLGIRLIQRTTRKLKLTPEGEELFNRAQPLVDDLEAVQDDISASKTELRGRLRLTMPTEIGVFMMNEVITSFMQTYPKLEVDVELSTRTVDLIEEGVDLALRLGPLPNSSLIARHIAGLHRGLFATPEYLEQHGMPKTPDDLAHHQCISLLKPFDHLRFTNWNDNEPVTMGGRLRTNSMSFVRDWSRPVALFGYWTNSRWTHWRSTHCTPAAATLTHGCAHFSIICQNACVTTPGYRIDWYTWTVETTALFRLTGTGLPFGQWGQKNQLQPVTTFTSRYSSSPQGPPSRPLPDCL